MTAKLICAFVFAYAKSRFSYDAAHIISTLDRWICIGTIIQGSENATLVKSLKKSLKLNYLFPIMINETGNIIYMSHLITKQYNVVNFRQEEKYLSAKAT